MLVSPWTAFDKVVDRRIVREDFGIPCDRWKRGVLVSPGTLSNKRHCLASERSVTLQVCEVSLGAAGQIRTAPGETSRRAVGLTTAIQKVNLS